MLLHAGYFRELAGGLPTGPSIMEAREQLEPDLLAPVVAYLSGGTLLNIAPSPAGDDWFTGAPQVARLGSLTDGEWTWPMSLAYYVQQHRVAVPQEFLTHMKRHAWRCPAVSKEALRRVIDEITGR